jgi:hypothetical protein
MTKKLATMLSTLTLLACICLLAPNASAQAFGQHYQTTTITASTTAPSTSLPLPPVSDQPVHVIISVSKVQINGTFQQPLVLNFLLITDNSTGTTYLYPSNGSQGDNQFSGSTSTTDGEIFASVCSNCPGLTLSFAVSDNFGNNVVTTARLQIKYWW